MNPDLASHATVQVLNAHLKATNKSVGRCLFSSHDGDQYKDFQAKVAGQGPFVLLMQCTTGGADTVLGGIASSYLVCNVDAYMKDPIAVLIDEHQVHFSNPSNWAIRFVHNYGPIWGPACLQTSHNLSGNVTAGMTVAADVTYYATWTARLTPVCKHIFVYSLENAPLQPNSDFATVRKPVSAVIEDVIRGLPTVTVGVAAVAGSGKSTLLNSLISLVKERSVSIFNAGGGAGNAGQRTTRAQVVGIYEGAGRQHPQNKDVMLRDSVGSDQMDELIAHLKALLENGEVFNRDRPFVLTPGPMDAAHCILLLIPEGILSRPLDQLTLNFFNNVKHIAATYNANKPNRVFQLSIIPIITKVDTWCANPERRITDRSCLLSRAAGPLKPLFDKLSAEPFCFQPRNAYAIGWLEDDCFSYSDPTDPVVMALKLILSVAVDTSATFVKLNRLV